MYNNRKELYIMAKKEETKGKGKYKAKVLAIPTLEPYSSLNSTLIIKLLKAANADGAPVNGETIEKIDKKLKKGVISDGEV